MWFSPTAIPAIAPYARVTVRSLDHASQTLSAYEGLSSEALVSSEFARMQQLQPTMGERIGRRLALPLDDAARGLGVTLSMLVWLAFEYQAQGGLGVVQDADWEHAEQVFKVDEDLRKNDPRAVIESDDIIAIQQPEIARFVRERVEATVRAFEEEIDVDDVDAVYRLVLVEVLALSYAVRPPADWRSAPEACS